MKDALNEALLLKETDPDNYIEIISKKYGIIDNDKIMTYKDSIL